MSLACLLLSFNLLSRCEPLCLVSSLAGVGGGVVVTVLDSTILGIDLPTSLP